MAIEPLRMTWDELGMGRRRSASTSSPTASGRTSSSVSPPAAAGRGRARLRARREEHVHDERRVLHRRRRAAGHADDPPARAALVDLHEAHVLIADDVADTGQTLVLVKESRGQGGRREYVHCVGG